MLWKQQRNLGERRFFEPKVLVCISPATPRNSPELTNGDDRRLTPKDEEEQP